MTIVECLLAAIVTQSFELVERQPMSGMMQFEASSVDECEFIQMSSMYLVMSRCVGNSQKFKTIPLSCFESQ